MMKVLVACEQSPFNPYMYFQYLGICKEAEVVNATGVFWTSNLKFDIIHLHWPEFLVDYRIHDDDVIEQLISRIEYWRKRGAKIVMTRHNYIPHPKYELKPKIFEQIYHTLYTHVDGIVHHGQHSLNEFLNHKEYSQTKNVFIQHPNYLEGLKNTISREEARQKLKLNNDAVVFTTFGEIRTEEEQQQVIEAFSNLQIKNKVLYITRSYFVKHKPGKGTPIKYIKHHFLKKKYASQNIIFDRNKIIDTDDIQTYMNASDVIISPRINNLNSGIIFLAFSYGKIVIGPNVGNISEMLDVTKNPKFEPQDMASLTNAMKDASELLHTDTAKNNLEYITQKGDIYTLGTQYLDLYKSLIK